MFNKESGKLMKEYKTDKYKDYEVISCSDRCYECLFKCEVVINDMKQLNLSCRHPKGPGNPVHCIYFKITNSS